MAPCKVLFLASNPSPTGHLALDEEARDIREKLRASEHRDAIALETRWAVRADDLLQALNEDRPTVVHFSGHGTGAPGIALHDGNGGSKLVTADALKRLFTALKDDIRVVVLNACHTGAQADAIVEVIDCVICMTDAVGDEAARKFAASFYRALGFGRNVKNAFEQGLVSIAMEGLRDASVPTLLVRPGVDAQDVHLLPKA
jgi:CHAT domain-containing protein